MQLAEGVQSVPGVGPHRAGQLRRAGVLTVGDLLTFLPRRYEDRSRFVTVADLAVGEAACVEVVVGSCRRVGPPGRRARTELHAADSSGTLHAVWFNQGYVAEALPAGSRVRLYGQVQRRSGALQMVNPVHALVEGKDRESLHMGRHVPVYPRAGGLGSGTMRRLLVAALDGVDELRDPLPESLVRSAGLIDLETALRHLHYPPPGADLEAWNARRSPAHRRLIMQEFIDYQAALMLQRRRATSEPGTERKFDDGTSERIQAALPFRMTAAQQRCTEQILADLCGAGSMHRLLHGDVGCGKTAVAACAMFAVALHGEQTALLVPSAIVAEQHARTLGQWGGDLGLEVATLTAATDVARRREMFDALAAGECNVIVGTQALLQPRVRFKRLGLVVVDEQHRFGVAQRALLGSKGRMQRAQPDLLVMTATPIPRSLALTLYGDLEVSKIDELPPGRAEVNTRCLHAEELAEVDQELRRVAAAGERAFVVAPRIDEAEAGGTAAIKLAKELQRRIPEVGVGLVHGDLDGASKARAMERFITGVTPVLVSTTVIEVGVDVPEATLMVIEDAERFGLAQLHQLRGRVGRGVVPGRCWLIPRGRLSEPARQRLLTLCETQDGFRIAEEDLRLRGPGEILGTRQAGPTDLRVGDPHTHADWLEEAHAIARALVDSDDTAATHYRERLRSAWRTRMQLARSG